MDLRELVSLIKANNAATLSVNTTLLPAQALKLINLIVSQSAFLQKVSRVDCYKLKTPMPIMNLSGRNLTRVAEGTAPTTSTATYAQSANEGKILDLLNVDLFYDLLYSVIINNQDEKTLVSMIEAQIAETFANDLLDLATNGTADTYVHAYHVSTNPVPMYTLAKGWIKLLQDSSRSNKVNRNADSDLLVSLKKCISAMPNAYKTPNCKLIMSPANFETYQVLMGAKDSSAGIYLQGNAKSYLGYGIEVNPYMPDGVLVFSDLKDLVFAPSVVDVQKAMENKPRTKCVEYTYTLPVDFEIARDRAMVIAWDQGA
jgi:hypothetical protein